MYSVKPLIKLMKNWNRTEKINLIGAVVCVEFAKK